jgi:DNA transposition AAA+ family ATPase
MTAVALSPDRQSTASPSEAAAASSAYSRINVPLNLDNWRTLPDAIKSDVVWFHQHTLDQHMSWRDCAEALGYDQSTVFRVLKGTYEGSWDNIARAIRSYRKLILARGQIQRAEFVETRIASMIFAALDYSLANNSIALITGESRQGKTVAAREWRDRNNHGRSVYVIAPAYGGTKALLRDIAAAVGVSRNLPATQMQESIIRAFNKNRILIVDEAHRLLPGDRRSNPVNLEVLRDIHDRTDCALALIATARFETELRRGEYMYEQLIGRIGMPVRLPKQLREDDILPIVNQYIPRPSRAFLDQALAIANAPGRLGILVETFRAASRLARKKNQRLAEEHFDAALKLRRKMEGADS